MNSRDQKIFDDLILLTSKTFTYSRKFNDKTRQYMTSFENMNIHIYSKFSKHISFKYDCNAIEIKDSNNNSLLKISAISDDDSFWKKKNQFVKYEANGKIISPNEIDNFLNTIGFKEILASINSNFPKHSSEITEKDMLETIKNVKSSYKPF